MFSRFILSRFCWFLSLSLLFCSVVQIKYLMYFHGSLAIYRSAILLASQHKNIQAEIIIKHKKLSSNTINHPQIQEIIIKRETKEIIIANITPIAPTINSNFVIDLFSIILLNSRDWWFSVDLMFIVVFLGGVD